MKKNYKFSIFINLKIIFSVLILFFFQNASFSEDSSNKLRDARYACSLFYNKISNSDDLMARNAFEYFEITDFGFFPKSYYDDDKNDW